MLKSFAHYNHCFRFLSTKLKENRKQKKYVPPNKQSSRNNKIQKWNRREKKKLDKKTRPKPKTLASYRNSKFEFCSFCFQDVLLVASASRGQIERLEVSSARRARTRAFSPARRSHLLKPALLLLADDERGELLICDGLPGTRLELPDLHAPRHLSVLTISLWRIRHQKTEVGCVCPLPQALCLFLSRFSASFGVDRGFRCKWARGSGDSAFAAAVFAALSAAAVALGFCRNNVRLTEAQCNPGSFQTIPDPRIGVRNH